MLHEITAMDGSVIRDGMNIALNALCINNRSGTGRYTFGLIDGFAQCGIDGIHLSVFLPAGFSLPTHWQKCPNIRFYSIPAATAWQRIVWEQYTLPSLLRKLSIKTLHSPAFICPCIFPDHIRHIITIHDTAYLTYPNTMPKIRRLYLQTMIQRSINHAELIVTDSKSVADELKHVYKINQPVHPIQLGVDRLKFTPEKSEKDAEVLNQCNITNPYYLFVGTIEPRKNIETVLRSFQQSEKRGLQKELVIVGRYGWMVDKNLLQAEGVRWLGHVNDDDLPALYRHADALIAPSLYEGFDLPTVEALACGTPVIASDIPVHREVLGSQCQYVPALDTNAWVDAMTHPVRFDLSSNYNRTWVEVALETCRLYHPLYRL